MEIAVCGGDSSQYIMTQTEVSVFKHMIWTSSIVSETCILWLNLCDESNWKVDNFRFFFFSSNVKSTYVIYKL
jgi:hypothetical protein